MKGAARPLALSVALLLIGGCATGGSQPGGEVGSGVRVIVVNDLSPPTSLTVRVSGEATVYRTILGNVSPRTTRTFSFEPRTTQASFRLVAEAPNGQEITSRVFQASLGDEVEWSVRRNAIDLRRQMSRSRADLK